MHCEVMLKVGAGPHAATWSLPLPRPSGGPLPQDMGGLTPAPTPTSGRRTRKGPPRSSHLFGVYAVILSSL